VSALRRRKHRKKPPGRGGAGRGLLIFAAVVVGILLLIHARFRPVVESMAAYQAKVFAVRTIDRAMLAELDASRIAYGDLVQVTQNSEGMITSIQADMVGINRLKSYMAERVLEDLSGMEQEIIYVPLGNLLGTEWLSGRGPDVQVRVVPIGFMQSEIYNEFVEAGINQTNHRIMMRITVRMRVLVPGYNIQTESSTDFCIAETVIVGRIPDTYLQVTTDSAPLLTRIGN